MINHRDPVNELKVSKEKPRRNRDKVGIALFCVWLILFLHLSLVNGARAIPGVGMEILRLLQNETASLIWRLAFSVRTESKARNQTGMSADEFNCSARMKIFPLLYAHTHTAARGKAPHIQTHAPYQHISSPTRTNATEKQAHGLISCCCRNIRAE